MNLVGDVRRYIDEQNTAHRPCIEVVEPCVWKILARNIAQCVLIVSIGRQLAYGGFEVEQMAEEKTMVGGNRLSYSVRVSGFPWNVEERLTRPFLCLSITSPRA